MSKKRINRMKKSFFRRAVFVGAVFVLIVFILFFVSKFVIKDFREFLGLEKGEKKGIFSKSEVSGERALLAPLECSSQRCVYVDAQLTSDCVGNYNIQTRACSGSDGNAYNTIQEAADIAVAGDIVYVRGGVYHETITLKNSGSEGSYISYLAYPGEKAVIDASLQLNGWQKCASQSDCFGNPNYQNIYYTLISEGIYPLGSVVYEDETVLKLAQDPNQPDEFLYDNKDYFIFINKSLGMDITNISIKDPFYFNQPDSNYWNQAYVAVWGGNNNVVYEKIDLYDPLSNMINFTKLPYSALPNNDRYSILNHIMLLDTPGEYYIDNSTSQKKIYVWPKTLGDINVKNMTYSNLTRGFSLNGKGYIRIEGFEIVKQAAAALNDYNGGSGIVNPSVGNGVYRNIIIRDNIIGKGKGYGIFLFYCDYCLVEGNYIYDMYSRGIFLSNQNYSAVINNTLRRLAGTGIDYYHASFSNISDNKLSYIGGHHANGLTVYLESDNVFVERNIVTDSNIALTFQSSVNITARNNVFVGAGESRVIAGWNGLYKGGNPYGIYILHNTAINSSNDAALYIHRDFVNNVVVKNNILDGGDNLTGREHSNNLFTGLTWNQRDNLSDFNESLESNLSKIFVDWMNGDYHLSSGSPAINNGTAVPVFEDYDRNVRPQGAGWDIGAYEYISQGGCSVGYASNVSQWNITWYFDKCYRVGNFVNGDYWVVGPVTIVNITPEFDGQHHGWEANPSNIVQQGFDVRASNFNASFVPTLPYIASSSTSIVKAISMDISQANPICSRNVNHNCYLKTAAVLSVLGEVPANEGRDAFRPPYFGREKPLYLTNQLRTELLPSVKAAGTPPSLSSIEERFRRVQLDHQYNWMVRRIHPDENMPDYGGDIALDTGDAALRLMLNDSIGEKMPALIQYLQMGIDWYHILKNGGSWLSNGGHSNGRKLPIIFAGILFNNQSIKDAVRSAPYNTFQEDGHLYWSDVANNGLGEVLFGDPSILTYWLNQVTDSGSRTARDPYYYIDGGPVPGTDYQMSVNSMIWKGPVVAIQLMPEVEDIWNNSQFKQYVDRWVNLGAWAQPDPCAPVEGRCVWGSNAGGYCTYAGANGSSCRIQYNNASGVYYVNVPCNSYCSGGLCAGGICNSGMYAGKGCAYEGADTPSNSCGSGISCAINNTFYGTSYGPDPSNSSQCILDTNPTDGLGRHPYQHGKNKNQGNYQSAFVNAMWNAYRNYTSLLPNCSNGIQDLGEEGVDCGAVCGDVCARAIARFDVVPYQTFQNSFNVGVVAFHKDGIKQVEFRYNTLSGIRSINVTQMTRNPQSDVVEYWTTLQASDFADGLVNVTAMAYPYTGWNRELSLELYANAGGSLGGGKLYVSFYGNDTAGDGSQAKPFLSIKKALETVRANLGAYDGGEIILMDKGAYDINQPAIKVRNTRWITIKPVSELDRRDVIIAPSVREQVTPQVVRLKFYGLSFDFSNISQMYKADDEWEWYDNVRWYQSEGWAKWYTYPSVQMMPVRNYGGGLFVTNSLAEDTIYGFVQATIARNNTAYKIGCGTGMNSELVINSLVVYMKDKAVYQNNSQQTYCHADTAQYYGNWSNVINYGVKVISLYGIQNFFLDHYQSNFNDMAFINMVFENLPTQAVLISQLNSQENHILFMHVSTTGQDFLLRNDQTDFAKNFSATNVKFVNSVFESLASSRGWPSGVMVESSHFKKGTLRGSNASTGNVSIIFDGTTFSYVGSGVVNLTGTGQIIPGFSHPNDGSLSNANGMPNKGAFDFAFFSAIISSCFNGKLDAEEQSIDCGGNCNACSQNTCTDGWQNGDETGVDCGGSCPPCLVDNQPPIINLIKPNNNEEINSNNVEFSYNVSDLSSISNCILYIGIETRIDFEIENSVENNFSVNLQNGNYVWNISCVDARGNIGISESRNLSVNYQAPPPSGDGGTPSGGGGGGGFPAVKPKPKAENVSNVSVAAEELEKIILGDNLSFIDISANEEEKILVDLYGNSYAVSFALSNDGLVLAKLFNGDYIIPRGEVLQIGLGKEEMYVGVVTSDIGRAKVVLGLDASAVKEKVGKVEGGGVIEEGRKFKGLYYALMRIVGVLIVVITALVVWYVKKRGEER